MALALARSLVREGKYDALAVRKSYVGWMESDPFDIGGTTRLGLMGKPTFTSQANGAMMRVSPLGLFGAREGISTEDLSIIAMDDAAQTHQHDLCRALNALYVLAISDSIRNGSTPEQVYSLMEKWAEKLPGRNTVSSLLKKARNSPPETMDGVNQGWVALAFHNAVWQLLHARNFEEGVVDTISRGGDTDTNAAIAGALLGSVHGYPSIPAQWADCVLNCRSGSMSWLPRPECYWPADALSLALQLAGIVDEISPMRS
jgi:ADP-ribosylglycohydrolase